MRTLKRYIQDVKIKWPNDILVENKKIAGILIEIKGNIAFIGIGINVENEIPDELKEIAISLKEKVCLNKNSIFNEIIKEQENLNDVFLKIGFKGFKEEYEKNLILINKEVTIKNETTINGVVKGVTEDGELILKNKNNEIKISHGTVISYN